MNYSTENSGLVSDYTLSVAVDKNQTLWVGTNRGVSRFDGVTWTRFTKINSGLADNNVNAIAVEKNNTIWFGTDNGVSKYTGEVITVSVDETKPQPLPLIKSYPNPFNPTTTIEYDLPETGMAALTIYNIAGQKVRELLSGYKSAGMHRVIWDGTDESGNAVSAGVYIARLKAGEAVATGKMVLVR
ncbi:FlgD immunoglobulin-like domain containing protein [Candidatus Omnitrophota bacterium]